MANQFVIGRSRKMKIQNWFILGTMILAILFPAAVAFEGSSRVAIIGLIAFNLLLVVRYARSRVVFEPDRIALRGWVFERSVAVADVEAIGEFAHYHHVTISTRAGGRLRLQLSNNRTAVPEVKEIRAALEAGLARVYPGVPQLVLCDTLPGLGEPWPSDVSTGVVTPNRTEIVIVVLAVGISALQYV